MWLPGPRKGLELEHSQRLRLEPKGQDQAASPTSTCAPRARELNEALVVCSGLMTQPLPTTRCKLCTCPYLDFCPYSAQAAQLSHFIDK